MENTYNTKNTNNNRYTDREGLVYVRVSSKKQEVEGHGRESQEARCKKELSSLGVTYLKTFPDTYSGGGDFIERPAMKALLEYIDAHPHKKFVVIFDDLKRFARDTIFHLKLRTALKARDTTPLCLNYKFDDSPEGMFVETVLAAGNELERHQNKRQVVQKMKARLEAGYWAFGSKRGYKSHNDALHGKISIIDHKDSQLLKTALEGFSTGIFVRKIDACKFLVEKEFWKRSPEKYVHQFDKILRDIFYAGFIEYPDWDVKQIRGHHQPIISIETYQLTQKRLSGSTLGKSLRADVSSDLYLRGLLICTECDKHLCGGKTKGNGGIYWYYFCQNKSCSLYRKSINRDVAHTKFDQLLIGKQVKPQTQKLMNLVFERTWQVELKLLHTRERERVSEKNTLNNKIDQLADLVIKAKSQSLKDTYEKQLEKTSFELDQLSDSLTDKVDLSIPYQTAIDKANSFLNNPYEIWSKVDQKEKHKLFFFIFDEKLAFNETVGYQTNKVPSAIRLFEEFVNQTTDDVDPTRFELVTSSLQMRRSTN